MNRFCTKYVNYINCNTNFRPALYDGGMRGMPYWKKKKFGCVFVRARVRMFLSYCLCLPVYVCWGRSEGLKPNNSKVPGETTTPMAA